MKVLVTGGCGFIGSHVVKVLLARGDGVVNLDKLTYAGNLKNVAEVAHHRRYWFIKGDICNPRVVSKAAEGVDGIINLAAETHVDRSILSAGAFVQTDMLGTYVLLEEARRRRLDFFLQVSTDEVYGSMTRGAAREDAPLRPANPYSASKLGADRLAYSYCATYGLRVMVTRGSNTYGPFQFPEKLIPLTIIRAILGQAVPVYGDGKNVRDWLHAEDHARAICLAAKKGRAGETYNISGRRPMENIKLVRMILAELGAPHSLIHFVRDREGHDRRYAIDDRKIRRDLGWRQARADFKRELAKTVRWYVSRRNWWEPAVKRNAAFRRYFEAQYGKRWKTSGGKRT